jgi:hypothetical protein
MKALTAVALAAVLAACQKAAPPPRAETGPTPGSPEWKIQNAMSAAPEAVSAKAQVVEVRRSELHDLGRRLDGTHQARHQGHRLRPRHDARQVETRPPA